MDQGARQIEPAAHPAGICAGQLLRHIGQTHQLEQLVGPSLQLRPRNSMHASDELDVLATCGKAIKSRRLQGEPEAPTDIRRPPHHVEPGYARHAAGRSQQRREDTNGGGLARAVRTQETD